jgi:hypothetical protein
MTAKCPPAGPRFPSNMKETAMKIFAITTGVLVVLAVPTWAAEDFTGTKEVRLIQGDLGSAKAKTVVITDNAKIKKLLGTINLEKKEPCAHANRQCR